MFDFANAVMNMDTVLYIKIPGVPKSKERHRFNRYGKPYTPEETKSYEEYIRVLAKQAVAKAKGWSLEDSYELHIIAYFSIPESWPKWKKEAALAGEYEHITKPDFDNVDKIICDAMNKIVWKDDSRISRSSTSKQYTAEEPYVGIAVWRKPVMTYQDWMAKKALNL